MHTPLDPHLHTEECNKIIAQLIKCHEENSKLSQLFGVCNDLDMQMRKCTKKERIEKRNRNHQLAEMRLKKMNEPGQKKKAEIFLSQVYEEMNKEK